jgi:hypothetical protein
MKRKPRDFIEKAIKYLAKTTQPVNIIYIIICIIFSINFDSFNIFNFISI